MRITLEDVLAKEKKSFDTITFELFSLIIDKCKRTRNKEICVSEGDFQRITEGMFYPATVHKWFPVALSTILSASYTVKTKRRFWFGCYLQAYTPPDRDGVVFILLTDWFCECIQKEGICR